MATAARPAHLLRIPVHSLATAQEIHPLADHAGDIKIEWTPGDGETVRLAKEAFKRARAKGFSAFRMSRGGRIGDPITVFDESAEELMMVPPIVGGAGPARSTSTKPQCAHHVEVKQGYLAWHQWAEEQDARGVVQTQCPVCERWLFPEEMGQP
jgi:hypothetical protein